VGSAVQQLFLAGQLFAHKLQIPYHLGQGDYTLIISHLNCHFRINSPSIPG
jgi:hypothetical protein